MKAAIETESSNPRRVVKEESLFFLLLRLMNYCAGVVEGCPLIQSAPHSAGIQGSPRSTSYHLYGCTPISKFRVERASRYWYCALTYPMAASVCCSCA